MKIKNKKAFFNYEILESFETGIVLTGAEVKSIKTGRANIGDAHVKILNNELWLINCEIPKYPFCNDEFYDSNRTRKLLVQRKEISQLESKVKQKRLTLIPLSLYIVRGRIKVEVGLGKGKRDYEKKEALKERDLDRELLNESKKYVV